MFIAEAAVALLRRALGREEVLTASGDYGRSSRPRSAIGATGWENLHATRKSYAPRLVPELTLFSAIREPIASRAGSEGVASLAAPRGGYVAVNEARTRQQ